MIEPFFFSSRRRHTRWPRDWSSDVCSSDLTRRGGSASDNLGASFDNSPDLFNNLGALFKNSPAVSANLSIPFDNLDNNPYFIIYFCVFVLPTWWKFSFCRRYLITAADPTCKNSRASRFDILLLISNL